MEGNNRRSAGTNVEIEVDDDTLIVYINLNERHGPSGSGKTTIVASTLGNVKVPGFKHIKLGINCFTKD